MPSQLPWLENTDPFPDPSQAWGPDSPAPGLLAAGGKLDVPRLVHAYRQGIFPWFSAGQPVLWWSPNPRMVLKTNNFRLHRSLRKTIQKFRMQPGCEIKVDHDFQAVISHCAERKRKEQSGTWIVPSMVDAYNALHKAGYAHSIETWMDGRLMGGLYCIGTGRAVFGESMFALATDASKIALAALVCICLRQQVSLIDCQQNTAHLASLGAREIERAIFLRHLCEACAKEPLQWSFDPVYWDALLPSSAPAA